MAPELGVVLTPVWTALHWPVAMLLAAAALLALANALRPAWTRPRLVAGLAVDGFALMLVGTLLAGGPWAKVTGSSIPAAMAIRIATWMNLILLRVLVVAAVVYGVRLAQRAWRLAGRGAFRNRVLRAIGGE
jgi:hypothetical protein